MTPRILVCGEALVDLVPVPSQGSGPAHVFAAELGGGPFNVAVTLGRLDCSVGFVSRISTDPFGHRIITRLIESGVDVAAVQRGNEPTTLAVTALDETGAAGYTFYAEGTADRLVTDPGSLPPSVAAVSFGTLSLLYEPGAVMYSRLLARAHAERRLTMLDPNIRPPAIDDPDQYRRRFTSWLESVHILKVSEDDANWLGSGAGGTRIAQWLDAGVAAVVLTRGGDGMSVITPTFQRDVAAPPVTVVDTIGAGDTAHGALLAWLDRDGALDPATIREYGAEDWVAALKFAAGAAAITVSRRGADPPWARELHND
ncbi:MAG: carbohydrate kinase [Aldersonia sp.]|nr:carbohydrate kinase [Aldersonia sp.]